MRILIVTVKTSSGNTAIEYGEPIRLDKALADSGIIIQHPCAGRGVCGKCAVKVRGKLSELTAQEINMLADGRLKNGFRLSCLTYAYGDTCIEFSPTVVDGLTDGIADNTQLTPKKDGGYAAVFDIGTTTLAASLVELQSKKRIQSAVELNAQAPYGADVISRMDCANRGALSEEFTAINSQIERIESAFPVKPDITVITGNTAMLHLYKGLSVEKLSVYPFTPTSLFGEWDGNTYIAPCIGAFAGADLTAAILASGMAEKKENSIITDLGTNGEMAYYSEGSLLCCATAMGPSFEGAGISSGMTAGKGAIDRVFIVGSHLEYSVIGDTAPVGLAGSGLIDTIACMLDLEEIDETGYLSSPYFIGDSGISVTPEDVRAVQLAKSAVRSGLETLCGDFDKISSFYIAGGFGSKLNMRSCVRIGLFPSELADKAVILGNASLSGGELLATTENAVEKAKEIVKIAHDINLGTIPAFTDKFMDNMFF